VINLKMTTHPAFFICGSIAFSGKLTQMSALPVGQPHNGKYVSICTTSSQQPVSLRYAAMFRLPAWGSKPRVSIALFRCVRTEAKAEIRNVHGEVIAQLGEAGCDWSLLVFGNADKGPWERNFDKHDETASTDKTNGLVHEESPVPDLKQSSGRHPSVRSNAYPHEQDAGVDDVKVAIRERKAPGDVFMDESEVVGNLDIGFLDWSQVDTLKPNVNQSWEERLEAIFYYEFGVRKLLRHLDRPATSISRMTLLRA